MQSRNLANFFSNDSYFKPVGAETASNFYISFVYLPRRNDLPFKLAVLCVRVSPNTVEQDCAA